MNITAEGVVPLARQVPSPNSDERPPAEAVTLIVLHNISLPPGEFGGDEIFRLFTNALDHDAHPYFASLKGIEVSAHFLVRRGGELIQFVPCARRAWHAGRSCWQGREQCNDFSIGIEIEGTDETPYTDTQYETLAVLVRALCSHYPVRDVVGHCDISPGRKSDPGPVFDWPKFRRMVTMG